MDGGVAAIGAAVIGLVAGSGSALLSGVIAYRAGRRQVQDQGLVEHRHWLRGQRQEAYMTYLSACDAMLNAVDECVFALATAEAMHDMTIYEGAQESVDLEVFRAAESCLGKAGSPLDRILMLGPQCVEQQALVMREAMKRTIDSLNLLTNALVSEAAPRLDDGWGDVTDGQDQVRAARAVFVTRARTTLASPTVQE